MVGLIPLNCRLRDYRVVSVGGEPRLVHRRALDILPHDVREAARDIFLVGVAEEGLFWKDIRRVLFTKARFRILCRLNYDGLRDSWTAVKLMDVLGEIAPDMKREVEYFGSGAMSRAAQGSQKHKFIEPRLAALVSFGDLLGQQIGRELTAEDQAKIEQIASENADLLTSVPESRKAFRQVADFLLNQPGAAEVTATMLAQLRVKACGLHGLLPGGSAVRAELPATPPSADDNDRLFVDAEIIAIYW